MNKKLLLTAAALGAMAFAGAASAGNITAASFTGQALTVTGSGATAKVSPFVVANEATLDATTGTVTDAATSSLTIGMDSPVAISGAAKVPFSVVYTITGPGTFDSTPAFSDLKAVQATPAVDARELAASSGVVVLSADKKTLSFFVEIGDAASINVQSLKIANLALKVTEKAQVSVSAEAKVTVAGYTQVVSSVAATPVVAFSNALKPSSVAAYTAVAALSDYKKFTVAAAAGGAVANATADTVTSNPVALDVNAKVAKSLSVPAPLTTTTLLAGATAVVTGPQVKDLVVSFASVATPAAATATSASYTGITVANVTALTNAGSLVLTNPVAPNTKVLEQGTYSVELKPTFATGFSANATQNLPLIKVDLAGTNFTAPWFALNNAGANSTLRLANNGSAPVGPIIISLKANNGTATPTGTHTIASIPAGQFVSLRGDVLKAAFGTDAANGDVQITIQSDIANVSAKVRTTQSTGQIYENSLGSGSAALTN